MAALQWICWQPTPYNDFLFRSLALSGIDLTVHFMERGVTSHPWSTVVPEGFRSRRYRRRVGIDWHLIRVAIVDRRSLFVVGGWMEPTVILLLNLLMALRGRFAIWTDTPDLGRRRNVVKRVLRSEWLRRVFKRARWVLGTGEPAIAALAAMGCPPGKLLSLPYVVDLDAFKHHPAPAGPGFEPVFLSCGRLVNAQKGYDVAIRALAQARQIGGPAFRYRIAGDGPDRASLEALAADSGLADRVEFLNWLEPGSLPHFYASGSVFLHTAHFDPYGVVVLEAMASGLAVIGSDGAGAVADRVRDGVNGLVYRAGDAAHLAEKVSFALTHPEKVMTMGVSARRTAEEWPVSRAVEVVIRILRS